MIGRERVPALQGSKGTVVVSQPPATRFGGFGRRLGAEDVMVVGGNR